MKNSTDLLAAELRRRNISFLENESLARHSTFKIGGAAALYAVPGNEEELKSVLSAALQADVPFFLLGHGSNVLFADSGYGGVVISTEQLKSLAVNGCTVSCECGVPLSAAATAARDASLAGLSFAYGIPGFVGGAVFMNAGAYGGQISDVLAESSYYDISDGTTGTLAGESHRFGYRESIYREDKNKIVLSARFTLKNGDKNAVQAEMEDYIQRRKTKQPLEFPSAGSVFKRYPGHFTGQLIEECGLKGRTVGGAQVSEKHAGFIINKGGATAADVLSLIDIIKEEVYKKYGFELECEMIYVG